MLESASVFNSDLEAGVRAIIALNAIYPKSVDFESLIKVDFIIINSRDFGGPESIHPSTPNRIGEISSRRETIRSGLNLMRRFGMIEVDLSNTGVNYSATNNVQPYLRLMKSYYSKSLLISAEWISKELEENGFQKIDLTLSEMNE